MLKHRVIPTLLIRDGGLVKTRKFKNAKYVGDPINAIRIFNEKEVDELMVLDIAASEKGREPDYSLIELFASECFMPVCYGGGIQTVEQARRIFKIGVEKICLQSAAIDNLRLVSDLAEHFGSQSIIISVDVKRNWLRKPCLFESRIGKTIKTNWLDFLKDSVKAGAGEAVINAVDKDGEMTGYDLDIVRQAVKSVPVPVIALGGAGKMDDFRSAVTDAEASAVAAGAMFVFHGPHRAVLITYPRYKDLEDLLSVQ